MNNSGDELLDMIAFVTGESVDGLHVWGPGTDPVLPSSSVIVAELLKVHKKPCINYQLCLSFAHFFHYLILKTVKHNGDL